MATVIFRLPSVVRVQLWTAYLRTARGTGWTTIPPSSRLPCNSLQKPYATVHISRRWSHEGRNAGAPVQQDEELPTLSEIVQATKAALDSYSSASESEKTAVLEDLERRVNSVPRNVDRRRAFRRRVSIALCQSDPLSSVQQAIRGSNPFPSPHGFEDSQIPVEALEESRGTIEEDEWADLLATDSLHSRDGKSVSVNIRDAEYILTHMAIPNKGSYPNTPAQLLDILVSTDPLMMIWQKYSRTGLTNTNSFIRIRYKERSELPVPISTKLPVGSHACTLAATLPGDLRVSAVGAGVSKRAAKKAAMLHILSKLHSSGMLGAIFDMLKTRGSLAPSSADDPNSSAQANEEGVFVQDHSSEHLLPTRQEYPDAPKGLLDVSGWRQALEIACNERGIICKVHSLSVSSLDAKINHKLVVRIGDIFSEHVIGSGDNKKADASIKMLKKLHTSGALHKLLATAPQTSEQDGHAADATGNHLQLRTNIDMPTRQQYPHAPNELFDEVRCPTAINTACQRLGFSMKVEGSSTGIGTSRFHYELKVDIANVASITSHGKGQTKQLAKRAAWIEAISKLHTKDYLRKLFPDPTIVDQKAFNEDIGQLQYEEQDLVSVANEVLEEERDAKVEIYNYAASMGLVPQFDVRLMQPRGRRRVKGRASNQQTVVQVSINLSELDISASRVSKSLATAEIAAALAFKRRAEEKQLTNVGERGFTKTLNSDLLTVETAPQFFEMYRSARHRSKVELEQELVQIAGQSQNCAKVLIDDVETGPPAIMQTKKKAEAVAYLGAALKIVSHEPDLLNVFAKTLQKDKGKVLHDVRPSDVTINSSTLLTMRDTLVEARRAGLPDVRDTLTAEESQCPGSREHSLAVSRKDREAASGRLRAQQMRFEEDSKLRELRDKRASLPMSQFASQVLQLVSSNPFSIIVGATGSGKTTQVPQILLDNAIRHDKGGFCDVICTQPRRLAASSIAARVAVERNEPLGRSAGYHIRFDARRPKIGGSITYCTTGILLEQLKHDADAVMDNVSHLVIDEVHERDISIDFLLNILRKAIRARQSASKAVPKVILMSATLDQKLFSTYFGRDVDGETVPCPVLSVPGRAFPVEERYLRDILTDLKSAYGDDFDQLMELDSSASKDYVASELAFSGFITKPKSNNVIDWKRERKEEQDSELQIVKKEKEDALVPLSLLASTVAHICMTTQDGSILAFLPGLQEIIATRDMLSQQPLFGVDFNDASKFKICLLHSAVPREEQQAVLDPLPPSCRKIILSTNIAETSVTVPDVKYVVDTGKLREKRYDQIRRITKLQCTWESNSNARQRAGRAGRVQEGYYYGLYTRERRQALAASGLPELLRSDLQETCLSIKAQGFKEPVAEFLAQSIQAPPASAVQVAISNLQTVEAFTSTQELTSLGRILSKLPVHPALGRMIILSIVFRCLDPILILSSMSNERSLFISPIGSRMAAKQAHAKYAKADSDHLALLYAFKVLKRLQDEVGVTAAVTYAQANFLHMGAFRSILSTAEQIEQILIESGLVPQIATYTRTGSKFGGAALNRHSDNTALVKCLLLAGEHPNLGVKNRGRSKAHRTPTEHGVLIHSGSTNFKRGRSGSETDALYAYNTLARSVDGNALFMRDTTQVTPLMVMLFGGKLHMRNSRRLEMDEWLSFKINAAGDTRYATQLVLEFRKALNRMLYGAFKSISDIQGGRSMSENLIVEYFVRGIVEIFNEEKVCELEKNSVPEE